MELVTAIVIFAIYFIPTIIASARGHPNYGAILVLNLLLGWTFLGWVVALVWSFTAGQSASVVSGRPREEAPKVHKKCPHCAEEILWAAVVCKYCGRDMPA